MLLGSERSRSPGAFREFDCEAREPINNLSSDVILGCETTHGLDRSFIILGCVLSQKIEKNVSHRKPNIQNVSRRNPTFRTSLAETLHSERFSPKGTSHTENQSLAPKFLGRVVRICFPGVFASSLVVTLTYAEMSTEKSRFLRAHGHGRGHGHGEQRRGRAPRGETRRSEKDSARAENAQTASNDGNDGARCFSCSENVEQRRDCGP